MVNEDDRLNDIEKRARSIESLLRRQARRPFVVEITGTPKAGKSTQIGLVAGFLRDCGWRVHVLQERASMCPLPMKGHFFFNTWTTGTMLAGLLDATDRDHDLVILDRGVFDSLTWLDMQLADGQVTKEEQTTFAEFATLERWRSLIDKVLLFKVKPQVAMERESVGRLKPRSGSQMNPIRLARFNQAMETLRGQREDDFDFMDFDNHAHLDPKQAAIALAELLLNGIEEWVDPLIASVPRSKVQDLVPAELAEWSPALEEDLLAAVGFRKRSELEDTDEQVQLLACGVQLYDGKPLVVERSSRGDSLAPHRDETSMLWRGFHVEQGEHGDKLSMSDLSKQLSDGLRQDMHLAEDPCPWELSERPRAMVWTDDDERRHLGIVFDVRHTQEAIAKSLDEKKFKTNGRGYLSRKSRFRAVADLKNGAAGSEHRGLEKWSQLILEHLL